MSRSRLGHMMFDLKKEIRTKKKEKKYIDTHNTYVSIYYWTSYTLVCRVKRDETPFREDYIFVRENITSVSLYHGPFLFSDFYFTVTWKSTSNDETHVGPRKRFIYVSSGADTARESSDAAALFELRLNSISL